jgi:hypothetical protein
LETELAVDMTNGAEVGEAAELMCEAITAIKQALALDKMAENARELGLDYEPVAMPENWFAGMPEEYRKEAWRVATPPAGQPAPVQEPVAFKQFLSDVHTAAGLVTHGKQCKALGERLSEGVMRYYMATSPAAQPAVPLTDEQAKQLLKDSDLLEMFENIGWYSSPRKAFNGNGLKLIRAAEAAHGITEKGKP